MKKQNTINTLILVIASSFAALRLCVRSLFAPTIDFANEAKAAAMSLFLPNQFSPDKENWVQLSPFGDFGNVDDKKKRVIQRFRKEDAEHICNEFNGALRKVTQPFGMPFYVGHPDHPRFRGEPGHTDTAAKGRGKEMAVRHDPNCQACAGFANSGTPCAQHGLFVKMHWNPDGEHIVANEAFHGHSVNWAAIPDGKENGMQIFRPVRVKSAGFTNEPQIPVSPATMANEAAAEEAETRSLEDAENGAAALGLMLLGNVETMPVADSDKADLINWMHAQLGTDPASGPEGLKAALTDKVTKAGHIDRVKKTRDELDKAMKKHSDARAALEQQIANGKIALANERKARATLIVETAVKAGRVILAEKEAKIESLCNAGDKFEEQAAALANSKTVVKTAAKTGGLAGNHERAALDERERSMKFEALMGKREKEFPNEEYADRFAAVSASSEGQQLFAQMKRAGKEE